jgi:hypothetical protein
MSTLIHILNKGGAIYNCAFYYPVPPAIYDFASVDDNRVPASDKLTSEEIIALKLGHIYEVMVSIDGKDKDEDKVKEAAEKDYTPNESKRLDDYAAEYSAYVGETWDGTSWV